MDRVWGYIDSPKLSAIRNMEIDQSLIENFDNRSVLRLYSWESDSFTMGRFQTSDDIDDMRKLGKSWAKRPTGGGILLHGFDISYSIVMSIDSLGLRSVKDSYEYLCSFLINFYQKLGLEPLYAKDTQIDILERSLFCQDGFEAYDILIDGKKIGGNAQRRTKKLLFQHGSVPLIHDSREFSGSSLQELGITLSELEAKELLLESFGETFAVKFETRSETV